MCLSCIFTPKLEKQSQEVKKEKRKRVVGGIKTFPWKCWERRGARNLFACCCQANEVSEWGQPGGGRGQPRASAVCQAAVEPHLPPTPTPTTPRLLARGRWGRLAGWLQLCYHTSCPTSPPFALPTGMTWHTLHLSATDEHIHTHTLIVPRRICSQRVSGPPCWRKKLICWRSTSENVQDPRETHARSFLPLPPPDLCEGGRPPPAARRALTTDASVRASMWAILLIMGVAELWRCVSWTSFDFFGAFSQTDTKSVGNLNSLFKI